MGTFGNKLAHAWNAFNTQTTELSMSGESYGIRPYTSGHRAINDKSIIGSVYNRLAIDVASVDMMHIRKDKDGNFLDIEKSGLNYCLTSEANMDQGARAFRQDIAMTLFEKGVIAVVAVDTTVDPESTNSFDVKTMRIGEIVTWYPDSVKVLLYNEKTGRKEEIILPKRTVSVIENPLFTVMNEPNGTLQRLLRKLSLLDSLDEQAASGKLDIIIQLPYVIKTEQKRQQAESRRKDIEMQLREGSHGIAYTDGTEKITQLNRPAENNMLKTVEYLTNMLYGQLGLTEDVFNGTADEKTMLNYHNRTIEPILSAITEGMARTFLSKTARSQGQDVKFFRDPFKLAALADIAELGDKLTRNEILTSNEMRSAIGYRPVKNKEADELRNKNLPKIEPELPTDKPTAVKESDVQNGTEEA